MNTPDNRYPKPEVRIEDTSLNNERKSVPLMATRGQEVQSAPVVFAGECDLVFAVEGAIDTPTLEMVVDVEDLAEESERYREMFDELGKIRPLEKFLTRSQITVFCRDNRKLIRKDGYLTMFPMEYPFVAFVRFNDEGKLMLFRSQWIYDRVDAAHKHRIVRPQ